MLCVIMYSFMMKEIRISIYKKNSSIKYITNTHGGVMQNENMYLC